MEDPTRIYAIPSSGFALPRFAQGLNGANSRANLVDVSSRGSVFKTTNFYKKTTILLGFLLFLAIVLFIIILSCYFELFKELQSVKNLCTSPECLRSASNLRYSMDLSADPCEDFYKFSCGHWSEEHPNHGWYPKFSTFETIDERISIATLQFLQSNETDCEPRPVKQTRHLYKSCLDVAAMDKLGYTVIYKYLKLVGLPEVPSYFNTTETEGFNWINASVNLKKVFATNLLIQFDIDADVYNRSNNVMYIGNGIDGPPLPSPFRKANLYLKRHLYRRLNDKDDEPEDDEDLDYATDSLLEAMENSSKNAIKEIIRVVLANVSSVPEEAMLDKAVTTIWNMTDYIGQLASQNSTSMDEIDLKKFTVAEFQNYTNQYLIDNGEKPMEVWKPYLMLLFKGSKAKFDFENDYLYLSPPEIPYVCDILLYISKLSKAELELYHWWAVVKSMIISTTTEISEYIYRETTKYNTYSGQEVIRTRSFECGEIVTSFMGLAVSYGIVDRTFLNTTKPKVEQMLNDIKEAFTYRVNGISWMDKPTKEATLDKTREMISFIGFPDWLMNKTALEIHYEDIPMSPTTYLENLMQLVQTYTPADLNSFREINEKSWRTDPTTVNAFNYFGDNTINVPMAILTFPMYHLGLEVLNYGALGSILGHELTHGFDNTGRKFDKEGNLIEWWTNETKATFEEKTKCFVSQYNNYKVTSTDTNVDGEQTLGENIADNGGLNHAFQAYQSFLKHYGPEKVLPGFENYTNNQMFFIAYGSIWCELRDDHSVTDQIVNDEHSPNRFRVLGSLQNSKEFTEAFHCPLNSMMNPNRTRCIIW